MVLTTHRTLEEVGPVDAPRTTLLKRAKLLRAGFNEKRTGPLGRVDVSAGMGWYELLMLELVPCANSSSNVDESWSSTSVIKHLSFQRLLNPKNS